MGGSRTGGSNPPLSPWKAKNRVSRSGPSGRVFACFGRARWQFGGKLDNTERTQTVTNTPDS